MDEQIERGYYAKAEVLLQQKNWLQLETLARNWLAAAPDDAKPHFYAGIAAMGRQHLTPMARHTRFLLEAFPDWEHTYHLACRYWLWRRQPAHALFYANQLIESWPDGDWGYYFAAASSFALSEFRAAQTWIETARRLSPANAAFAQLQLRIEHALARTSADILQVRQRCFEVLQLDPTKAVAHQAWGDFCLLTLDDTQQAIIAYRTSLQLDPTDPLTKTKLRAAVQRSNLLYRTVYGYRHLFWHAQRLFHYASPRFTARALARMLALLFLVAAIASGLVFAFPSLLLDLRLRGMMPPVELPLADGKWLEAKPATSWRAALWLVVMACGLGLSYAAFAALVGTRNAALVVLGIALANVLGQLLLASYRRLRWLSDPWVWAIGGSIVLLVSCWAWLSGHGTLWQITAIAATFCCSFLAFYFIIGAPRRVARSALARTIHGGQTHPPLPG